MYDAHHCFVSEYRSEINSTKLGIPEIKNLDLSQKRKIIIGILNG